MIRFIAATVTLMFATAAGADDLAPTGTLRATFLGTNPVQGRLDPATGEVRGPAGDIARELAKRHGVALTITPLIGVPAVIASVKEGRADIGFAAFDPQRAIAVDFSQSYSLAYNSYLVPANSPLRSLADIDKPGVRIGVGTADAADLFLSRTLKQAELKRGEARTIDALVKVMTGGEIDAYAGNRQRLIEAQVLLPNTRLLADNFLAVEQAIIVAKGSAARLAIVDRFLDEARASGFIRAALDRAGLSGVDVAPRKQ
jgi:polar amino acid transport system substrate-binding protein